MKRSLPFGVEYAWRPSWRLLERWYVRILDWLIPSPASGTGCNAGIAVTSPQKVLDLGSGAGCYSFYLGRFNDVEVSGVDIDGKRISESSHIAKRLGREN
jgi:SAM-dependent methyltransferase